MDLNDRMSSWRMYVLYYNDSISPCALFTALHVSHLPYLWNSLPFHMRHCTYQDTDVLFTTHGFQSTSLLFMKPGSYSMHDIHQRAAAL